MISIKKTTYKIIEKLSSLTSTVSSLTSTVSSHTSSISSLSNDYITAKGSSGSWRYRKWKSGKIEAWGGYEGTGTVFTVWKGDVRYDDITVSIPSGIFSSRPNVCLATSPSNQLWVASANPSSATAISVRLCTVASTSVVPYATFYAVQS